MDNFDIYKDISERTQGDIYIGVVGPVRTGKSTFIRRFMDLLVIPNIENSYKKERAKDTLPQSGSGKTITTVEPKFVPNEEAVEILLSDNARMRVRMVDCVGYMVNGATGHIENDELRMVKTPWFEEEIPFIKAAEIGTKKVVSEHSTIGLVVTTDGSLTDIPRDNYLEAEEKVISELKELNKPFVVLLNSLTPYSDETKDLKSLMEEKYQVPVKVIDALNMKLDDITDILEKVLYEFPVKEIGVNIPEWVEALDNSHWLKKNFVLAIKSSVVDLDKLRDIKFVAKGYEELDFIGNVKFNEIKLGEGKATLDMKVQDGLFFKILGEISGSSIESEFGLLNLMKDLTVAKKEYDKISEALRDVRETGYGIVPPQMDELRLEEPEPVKQGSRCGLKLRASAPSLHLIRANVETEVTPIVGIDKQGSDMVKALLEEYETDPQKLWQANMFGKSLEELVKEGLQSKIQKMPEDIQAKLQRTLQRIVNEGSGSLICIIL
ncbi:stage IV sporulation protein A [Clostridium cylindrosporum]|uniref:Stage IV sporulation protein A n=1 Tax=Clostridium cylindrosporum DSM 605 TaxID=1121307 RepID=A0A0J8DAV2_CLOCY|nr:stage IV sporulation protein A [Clostridium cylindrosporum]KMT21428.1 stage IV sporulation protein A [Clostridium cylindrosporum DSM 605]